jgi:cysteinyl-tRNA synthetase
MGEKVFQLAEKQLYYFYHTLTNMNAYLQKNSTYANGSIIDPAFSDTIEKDFIEAMDDDFNTAAAIAQLFSICKNANTMMSSKKYNSEDTAVTVFKVREKAVAMFSLLGLLQEAPESFIEELKNKYLKVLEITPSEIEEFIDRRNQAKQEKRYEVADEIRKELSQRGILLNDSKDGTHWDIKDLYSNG